MTLSKTTLGLLLGGGLFGAGIGWMLAGPGVWQLPVLLMAIGTVIIALAGRPGPERTAARTAQRPPVPPGYRDVSIPFEQIAPRTIWLTLILTAVPLVPFGALYGGERLLESPWNAEGTLAVVFGGSLLLIVVHELVHALTWMIAGRAPRSAIAFGFAWSALSPYTHLKLPIRARAYRLGVVMPGIVTGLLPGLIALAIGNGPLMLISTLLIVGAVGDLLVLWVIRAVPDEVLVLDHPSAIGCFVQETPR